MRRAIDSETSGGNKDVNSLCTVVDGSSHAGKSINPPQARVLTTSAMHITPALMHVNGLAVRPSTCMHQRRLDGKSVQLGVKFPTQDYIPIISYSSCGDNATR